MRTQKTQYNYLSEMNFSLLLVVTTTAVYTAAMTCDKMIWEKSSNENTRAANDIMEMGKYTVMTTRRTDSAEVQDLISTLDGASDIQYEHNSFTAILQPKDLKKVQQTDQQLEVTNIAQLDLYAAKHPWTID